MKTIKTLLKEWLRKGENKSNEEPPQNLSPKSETKEDKEKSSPPAPLDQEREEKEDQGDINNNFKNQKEHEREIDQSAGDSRLDNSAAPEIGRPAQEEQPGPSKPGRDSAVEEPASSPEEEGEKALSDYERGVIDGRNQQIEEKYFPKTDDGVPHFHGNHTRRSPLGDIFSMAREA